MRCLLNFCLLCTYAGKLCYRRCGRKFVNQRLPIFALGSLFYCSITVLNVVMGYPIKIFVLLLLLLLLLLLSLLFSECESSKYLHVGQFLSNINTRSLVSTVVKWEEIQKQNEGNKVRHIFTSWKLKLYISFHSGKLINSGIFKRFNTWFMQRFTKK